MTLKLFSRKSQTTFPSQSLQNSCAPPTLPNPPHLHNSDTQLPRHGMHSPFCSAWGNSTTSTEDIWPPPGRTVVFSLFYGVFHHSTNHKAFQTSCISQIWHHSLPPWNCSTAGSNHFSPSLLQQSFCHQLCPSQIFCPQWHLLWRYLKSKNECPSARCSQAPFSNPTVLTLPLWPENIRMI